jgi:WD40 repeat protein
MSHKKVFIRAIELLLVMLMITACAGASPTVLMPTVIPIFPTAEASPTPSELNVEKTLEPTAGISPNLQSTQVITPANSPQVTQLYKPRFLGIVGGSGTVAFSPNGDILAAGYYDGPVILYDMSTWKLLAVLTTQIGFIHSIAFSPDGKLIAAGGGIYNPDLRGVQIWDVATQDLVLKLDDFDEWVNSVAFSPDGAILATADGHPLRGGGSAKIWDVKTGELLAELTIQGKTGQLYKAFSDIAFNPDGTLLAAINADGNVQLWDAISHKEVGMMTGVSGEGSSVAFSRMVSC